MMENKIAFTAGQFDIIHPGYIDMFDLARRNSNHVIILLNTWPFGKQKPIFSVEERIQILKALRTIDEVLIYSSELGLLELIQNLVNNHGKDNLVRILGSDYIGRTNFTGSEFDIPILYSPRTGWSYSEYIRKVQKRV